MGSAVALLAALPILAAVLGAEAYRGRLLRAAGAVARGRLIYLRLRVLPQPGVDNQRTGQSREEAWSRSERPTRPNCLAAPSNPRLRSVDSRLRFFWRFHS